MPSFRQFDCGEKLAAEKGRNNFTPRLKGTIAGVGFLAYSFSSCLDRTFLEVFGLF
jgi:hypothetical protein